MSRLLLSPGTRRRRPDRARGARSHRSARHLLGRKAARTTFSAGSAAIARARWSRRPDHGRPRRAARAASRAGGSGRGVPVGDAGSAERHPRGPNHRGPSSPSSGSGTRWSRRRSAAPCRTRRALAGIGRPRVSSGPGSRSACPRSTAASAARRDCDCASSPSGAGAADRSHTLRRTAPTGSLATGPRARGCPAADRRPWAPPARAGTGGRPAVDRDATRPPGERRLVAAEAAGEAPGAPCRRARYPGSSRGDAFGRCARDRRPPGRPAGDPGTDADRYSPRLGFCPVVEGLSPTPNRVPSPVDANRNRNPNHPLEAARRPQLRTDRSEGRARRREAAHPGRISAEVVTRRAARRPTPAAFPRGRVPPIATGRLAERAGGAPSHRDCGAPRRGPERGWRNRAAEFESRSHAASNAEAPAIPSVRWPGRRRTHRSDPVPVRPAIPFPPKGRFVRRAPASRPRAIRSFRSPALRAAPGRRFEPAALAPAPPSRRSRSHSRVRSPRAGARLGRSVLRRPPRREGFAAPGRPTGRAGPGTDRKVRNAEVRPARRPSPRNAYRPGVVPAPVGTRLVSKDHGLRTRGDRFPLRPAGRDDPDRCRAQPSVPPPTGGAAGASVAPGGEVGGGRGGRPRGRFLVHHVGKGAAARPRRGGPGRAWPGRPGPLPCGPRCGARRPPAGRPKTLSPAPSAESRGPRHAA